ncbi:hypothetical protein EMIT0111MI5_80308 [Burkholderia sp. IT-111MI5]
MTFGIPSMRHRALPGTGAQLGPLAPVSACSPASSASAGKWVIEIATTAPLPASFRNVRRVTGTSMAMLRPSFDLSWLGHRRCATRAAAPAVRGPLRVRFAVLESVRKRSCGRGGTRRRSGIGRKRTGKDARRIRGAVRGPWTPAR